MGGTGSQPVRNRINAGTNTYSDHGLVLVQNWCWTGMKPDCKTSVATPVQHLSQTRLQTMPYRAILRMLLEGRESLTPGDERRSPHRHQQRRHSTPVDRSGTGTHSLDTPTRMGYSEFTKRVQKIRSRDGYSD
jgi:hypothetical protein